MFKISFPGLEVIVEGCPEAGIPAIDFRRKHGLPESPSNKQAIPLELASERLVRKYAAFADQNGDLADNTKSHVYGNSQAVRASLFSSMSKFGSYVRHVVSPMAVLGGLSGTEEGVDALLAELAADKAGENVRAEAEAEKAERESKAAEAIRELLADVEKSAESCIYRYGGDNAGKRWKFDQNHRYRRLLGDKFPESTNRPEVQPIIDVAKYLCDERNATELAEAEAEKAAAQVEMATWINAHGSTRLRRSLAEGIECEAAYRDERLAVERPGWAWYAEVPGRTDEPRNPPEDAFDILDEARKSDPAAKLAFYADDVKGYVAESTFLGRDIVYGVERLDTVEIDE